MMCRYGLWGGAQQWADLNGAMIGDGNVVRAIDCGGQANVRTILTHLLVTENAQCAHQIRAVDIARDFQTVKASSRTKWSRMILGIGPAAPSPK